MKRAAALLAFAALATVIWVLGRGNVSQAITRHWSFTKSVVVDHGTYFRLKVKLTYKGEPQDFDFVVGCNVRLTTYQDRGRSVDLGMVPEVFGRRMSDGKAVVIRPPRACRGETTANGGAPPDLLPMVIVYDNADNLAFGSAYMSEDAYESPLSELKFGGATIDRATRADFDESRQTQQNVLTHAMYWRWTAQGRSQPNAKEMPMWGALCDGFARFRLPENIREIVRLRWPSSKPRYWQPLHDDLGAIWHALGASTAIQSDAAISPAHSYKDFMHALELSEKALSTRAGHGQLNSTSSLLFPPAVYPDADGWGRPPWPRDQIAAAKRLTEADRRAAATIDFRNGTTKGFFYCRAPVNYFASSWKAYISKPGANRIDHQEIYVEGSFDNPIIFVERDEFVFKYFQIGLFTGMGDA